MHVRDAFREGDLESWEAKRGLLSVGLKGGED